MNFFLTVKMGKRASEEARERERERGASIKLSQL